LEPCGRCQTATAVRVALPCGRLVSMCIPCASVFARFLNKRIRDMARQVQSSGSQGSDTPGAPALASKDPLHSFPPMGGSSPRRARNRRLPVIDRRGEHAACRSNSPSPAVDSLANESAATNLARSSLSIETRGVIPMTLRSPLRGFGAAGSLSQRGNTSHGKRNAGFPDISAPAGANTLRILSPASPGTLAAGPGGTHARIKVQRAPLERERMERQVFSGGGTGVMSLSSISHGSRSHH